MPRKKITPEKDFGDKLYDLMKEHNISMDNAENMFNTVIKAIAKPIESALKAELNQHLGYPKNQISKNKNSRNGYSSKTVKGRFGTTKLDIPRDRDGTFEPQLIKKHQTSINSIENKIISLYARGLSTRDISDTIAEIYGFELDSSMVSRITDKIMPDIMEFQNRQLDRCYPIVFIDGMRFKTRQNGYAEDVTIYIAIGISLDGIKELIGFYIDRVESSKLWLKVLNDFKIRGLEKICIVVCDNLSGISDAIKAVYPEARIQKCIIHQIRNATKYVSNKDAKEICADMKIIYKTSTHEQALIGCDNFASKWSNKYPHAVRSWIKNIDELTTFYDFPAELRRLIYTTNPIESFNRTIRKHTKNKNSFPNLQALKKSFYLSAMISTKKWTKKVSVLRILCKLPFCVNLNA